MSVGGSLRELHKFTLGQDLIVEWFRSDGDRISRLCKHLISLPEDVNSLRRKHHQATKWIWICLGLTALVFLFWHNFYVVFVGLGFAAIPLSLQYSIVQNRIQYTSFTIWSSVSRECSKDICDLKEVLPNISFDMSMEHLELDISNVCMGLAKNIVAVDSLEEDKFPDRSNYMNVQRVRLDHFIYVAQRFGLLYGKDALDFITTVKMADEERLKNLEKFGIEAEADAVPV